jgi:hypothetical protein
MTWEHATRDFTDTKTLYFSTYTKNSGDALRVATAAFGNTPILHDYHGSPGYYRHYHAVTGYNVKGTAIKGEAHSFFGVPS